jgi:orotidine-5'-phosphate decarboxylase
MHWGDWVSTKAADGQLVLGIDPATEHAPLALSAGPSSFLRCYTEVLMDAARGLVGFVKFQSAFFEAFGSEGVAELARAIAVAKELDYAVILDAKRGDIGSTAEAYAQAYLSPAHAGGTDLEVDCLTINPFLGPETMEPFLVRARDFGKGLLVLVKTSNPDSGWLQDQRLNGGSVSDLVAQLVARWAEETIGTSGVGAVGAVVGATYPEQAGRLRKLMPRSPFLAPGLGAQGGDASALLSVATRTGPVLVSASRGVARAEDRDMPVEAYKALVRDRIAAYAAAGRPHGQTAASSVAIEDMPARGVCRDKAAPVR